jgi:hypothetical protein
MLLTAGYVTDSNDCTLSPSFRLWFGSLAWLGAGQLAIGIMSLPGTA